MIKNSSFEKNVNRQETLTHLFELSLLVDDEDNSISIPLAISVAPRFGITGEKAKELANEISC